MIKNQVPAGATHVEQAYGRTTFWKIGQGIEVNGQILLYGIESGEPFYSWQSWNGEGMANRKIC